MLYDISAKKNRSIKVQLRILNRGENYSFTLRLWAIYLLLVRRINRTLRKTIDTPVPAYQEVLVKFEVSETSQAVLFEAARAAELSACSAANTKFRAPPVSLDFFGSFFHRWKKWTGTRIEVIGSISSSVYFVYSRDFYFTGARKPQTSKVLKLEEEVLPARDAIAREQWFFSSVKCPRLAGAEA